MLVINYYFLPAIFSVMAICSLGFFWRKFNLFLRFVVCLVMAFFVVFIYFFIHYLFDGVLIVDDLFNINDAFASLVIFFLNSVVMLLFYKIRNK